ncbi:MULTISPECIES: hypothetical protein [Variovorax]|nr:MULTISPECIES: hypothetical protein [Variovorax]MDR6524345.1 hypothetical protein [Variovorax paradoxus]
MNIDLTKLDESQLVELNRQIVARLRYPNSPPLESFRSQMHARMW